MSLCISYLILIHFTRFFLQFFNISASPICTTFNHVCGRGVTKRLKEEFPGVQILPLDLDPDTSYANVENRLQMLIMNQTAEAEHSAASVEPAPQKTRGGSPRPALSST